MKDDKPTVRVKRYAYQPSKAEREAPVKIPLGSRLRPVGIKEDADA